MVDIRIKLINDKCMPERAEGGDWYDLKVAKDIFLPPCSTHELTPNPVMIPLGVAMEIPKGKVAIIAPRSSTPKKHGIVMANSIGVIDSSYNGPDDEWMFPAYCTQARGGFIKEGTRIAQFTLIDALQINFIEDSLEGNNNRGGFGSTGD